MTVIIRRWPGALDELLATDLPAGVASVWTIPVRERALILGSAQAPSFASSALLAGRMAGVTLLKRRSGGGAVWVDPRTTVWLEVVIPSSSPLYSADATASACWLGSAMAPAVEAVTGQPAVGLRASGTDSLGRILCFGGLGAGEVCLGSRKVVGVSQRRGRWGSRFQLAAYTEFDPEPLVSALDPERLDRPPAEACSELSERATGLGGTVAELAETMVDALVTAIGAADGPASSCS